MDSFKNGIILNGVFHRLAECPTEHPCEDCSLQGECWSDDAQCYLCELFGEKRMKNHYQKVGEITKVRRVVFPRDKMN